MKIDQLNIEDLVALRTKMILERKSTKEINEIIDEKEKEYSKYLVEDTSATGGPSGASTGGDVGSGGVAFSNAGISGMGSVSSAQPSTYSGSTIGNNWSNNGGTEGSGDVSNPFPGPDKMYQKSTKEMGKNHGARTGKKSRVKKMDLKALKNVFSKRQDFTSNAAPRPKKVMNFDDFQKLSLDKVTRLKN